MEGSDPVAVTHSFEAPSGGPALPPGGGVVQRRRQRGAPGTRPVGALKGCPHGKAIPTDSERFSTRGLLFQSRSDCLMSAVPRGPHPRLSKAPHSSPASLSSPLQGHLVLPARAARGRGLSPPLRNAAPHSSRSAASRRPRAHSPHHHEPGPRGGRRDSAIGPPIRHKASPALRGESAGADSPIALPHEPRGGATGRASEGRA